MLRRAAGRAAAPRACRRLRCRRESVQNGAVALEPNVANDAGDSRGARRRRVSARGGVRFGIVDAEHRLSDVISRSRVRGVLIVTVERGQELDRQLVILKLRGRRHNLAVRGHV